MQNMLLAILLLNLILHLASCGTDSKSTTEHGLEGLEKLVEELVEVRLSDVKKRMQDDKEELEMRLKYKEEKLTKEKKEQEAIIKAMEKRLEAKQNEMETRLEAKNKEMEARLESLADRMKEDKDESEKKRRELEASVSELRIKVEEVEVTKPSVRDLPIVIISAWRENEVRSPQTVTFESFLANYNNAARPGGGDGVLDLDSGIFTCITPGYYTVSFSVYAHVGPTYGVLTELYLYKNDMILRESRFEMWGGSQSSWSYGDIGGMGSRILILHLEAGDTLELKMTSGGDIAKVTLNIELTGLGFDYLV